MPAHPFPVLGGVYYAIIQGDADARPVSNVFCFHKAGLSPGSTEDATNAAGVATVLATRWTPVSANLLHTVYVGSKVKVYALGSPLLPAAEQATSATGGVAGSQHLIQVAGMIKHDVARRGKGSQSRTFMSPLSISSVTVNGDQVTDTWFTEANTRFGTFNAGVITDLVALLGGAWSYVQLSKGTVAVPAGGTFSILATSAERLISSQKRRLGR